MKKWLVRSPNNKIYHDIPTIEKAREMAQNECEAWPGRKSEVYELVETCTIPVKPAKFERVEA